MNGIFGVISAKFCIFDIASFFAIPPNSASYGLLEEFLFIFQRYKISTTLTNNLLERCQHFTAVPKLWPIPQNTSLQISSSRQRGKSSPILHIPRIYPNCLAYIISLESGSAGDWPEYPREKAYHSLSSMSQYIHATKLCSLNIIQYYAFSNTAQISIPFCSTH